MKEKLIAAAEAVFTTGALWWSIAAIRDSRLYNKVDREWAEEDSNLSSDASVWFLLLVAEAV